MVPINRVPIPRSRTVVLAVIVTTNDSDRCTINTSTTCNACLRKQRHSLGETQPEVVLASSNSNQLPVTVMVVLSI